MKHTTSSWGGHHPSLIDLLLIFVLSFYLSFTSLFPMMRYLFYHRHRRHFPPGVRERREGGRRGVGKARGPLYVYISTEVYQINRRPKLLMKKKKSECCLEAVWTLFVPCK
jgi:hypothetical protein